jgi:N6-L-threonylcarbamoyladenine synthase
VKVLGIESSADETSASVVEDGYKLLSLKVASSMDIHTAYGGIVPEISARSHIEAIIPVLDEALNQANAGWEAIDAIAVTYGPGLGGSLLIGVLTARTLAIAKNKPLYAVNHVEAHVYANFITESPLENYKLPPAPPQFPLLALIVSGGHSQIALFRDHFDYHLLGQTTDDAVGEAYDKVAKILGLPYPGGPSIERLAPLGDPYKFKFPKARKNFPKVASADAMQGNTEQRTEPYLNTVKEQSQGLTQQRAVPSGLGPYDFSFSGPKTAVLRATQKLVGKDFTLPSVELPGLLNESQKADIAASFQFTAIDTLLDALEHAVVEYQPKSIVIAGGVAASSALREQISKRISKNINYADMKLCTDNGAMIASLGYFMAKHNRPKADPFSLEIYPNLAM